VQSLKEPKAYNKLIAVVFVPRWNVHKLYRVKQSKLLYLAIGFFQDHLKGIASVFMQYELELFKFNHIIIATPTPNISSRPIRDLHLKRKSG
jgi:hypothetical protein